MINNTQKQVLHYETPPGSTILIIMMTTRSLCMSAFTRSDHRTEFLISFEAWAKLAQKWLVCAPLRIHPEPIN